MASQDERIFVEFSHVKLANLGVTARRDLRFHRAPERDYTPAGAFETGQPRKFPLRVTGALDGAEAAVSADADRGQAGARFRLGDIADRHIAASSDPADFLIQPERQAGHRCRCL